MTPRESNKGGESFRPSTPGVTPLVIVTIKFNVTFDPTAKII